MLYDPSMHAMIPQGAATAFNPDATLHMPQGYPNFKIPVQRADGRGIAPNAEGFIQQPQGTYNNVNQPVNYGYGRGGMTTKGGRGGRGGRSSMSGHNLNGRNEYLGSSKGDLNGNMTRESSFNVPAPRFLRQDGSHNNENHGLLAFTQGTERFPEYIDRGYVAPDRGYIPRDDLLPNEKCFKKSIGSDVETMTSLWIGSIAPGTTVEHLRKMLEEKVTVSYIKDLEADERSVALWTFAE
jgi:hypothetical protein